MLKLAGTRFVTLTFSKGKSPLPFAVSISETNIVVNTEHWSDCPVSLRESSFANEPYPPEPEFEGAAKLGIFKSQFIGANRPLVPGQKTALE
jgi:hypothetical protein